VRFAPGCYWIDPHGQSFLWVAANELPLLDELVPFLLARSGQALDDFGRWVAPRRSPEWVLTMLVIRPICPRREAYDFESLNFRTSCRSRSMRLSRARKGGLEGTWLRSQRERWSRISSGSGAGSCTGVDGAGRRYLVAS